MGRAGEGNPPKEPIGVGGLRLGPLEEVPVSHRSNRLSYGPFSQLRSGLCQALIADSRPSAIPAPARFTWRWPRSKKVRVEGRDGVVPALTFIATSNIVLHNRMTPVFVDVDRAAYNIDPALIEAKISPRTSRHPGASWVCLATWTRS